MLALTLCALLLSQDGGGGSLTGTWLQMPYKSELMTLKSDGTGDLMGHVVTWTAAGGVLRMTDNHGHADPFPYVLQGDQLDLTYNGQILTLVRKGSALASSVGESALPTKTPKKVKPPSKVDAGR